MRITNFANYLEQNPELFTYTLGELDNRKGLYVQNLRYDTKTFFTYNAIEQHELIDLLVATHHGRNIEQMTRVTGYYSKTRGWNPGKTGELQERHRSKVDG